MSQVQEEEKIRLVPPRVKKRVKKEIPTNVIKKGQLKVKKITNIGYVPSIIYSNGEEVVLGPVDYVIVYDPNGTRKIMSVDEFERFINGRIVVPISSKDFAQRVFILAELSRMRNRIIRYYFLVRPEILKSKND